MRQTGTQRALVALLAWGVALLLFFPILWMALTSFKSEVAAVATPPQVFFQPTLESYAEVQARGAELVDELQAAGRLVEARVVADPAERISLWRVREDGAGLAARSLTRPAHAGWEDAAVPPERLGDYLRAGHYGRTFIDEHLLPMASALWASISLAVQSPMA